MPDQTSNVSAGLNITKSVNLDEMLGNQVTEQETSNESEVDETVENTTDVDTSSASEETEESNSDDSEVSSDDSSDSSDDSEHESSAEHEEDDDSERVDSTPEDIDLSEVFVEVDGNEVGVDQLITELNGYKDQFNKIAADPFLKGFIEHYMATGNADDYLQAKAVDYDKVEDLDILRRKFERENSDLDPKTVEKMWKREIASKYQITPDLSPEDKETDDYEIAQSILKRDAQRARGEFKDQQSKFKTPEPKVAEQQQAQKFDAEAYRTQLMKSKEVEAFAKEGLLPLAIKSDNGDVFGYEASDPKQIIEMMVDDRNFWSQLWNDKTKTVDRTKQAKVYAYAANPDAFEQTLVEHGRTLEREDRIKEAKNIDGRLNRQTNGSQTKPSDEKAALLEAFRQAKKR